MTTSIKFVKVEGDLVAGNLISAVDATTIKDSGSAVIWQESGRKEVDLSDVINTNIVNTLGTAPSSINLIFNNNPQNQQIAMDLSGYTGTNDSVNVEYTLTTITPSGGQRIPFGRQVITPSDQNIQYFSAEPTNTPTPLVPLGSFYRFANNTLNDGSSWHLWVRISDGGTNGLDVEFKLEVMQQEGTTKPDPSAVILYQYKRYS